MRNVAVNSIHEAARKNKNIFFLTGDLGFSVIEKFVEELPDQIINTGIAEQNMIGVAAGLAMSGKKVFVYSIVPFATMRCFEQIRNDVCYQNLDVNIIGIGGGFAYGTHGTTHYGLEDMALMRSLPNMKVVAPADAVEASMLISQILDSSGPYYLRLNRGGEKEITQGCRPVLGKGSVLKNGAEVTIFAVGAITDNAFVAAAELETAGISVEIIHMHTLKPLDKEIIIDRVRTRKVVVSLEEHTIFGGLGSAISEVVAQSGISVPFQILGVKDTYMPFVGKQEFLRDSAGISAQQIVEVVKNLWRK